MWQASCGCPACPPLLAKRHSLLSHPASLFYVNLHGNLGLKGKTSSDFTYTSMSGTTTVQGVDDAAEFKDVDNGLKTCNFTEDDRLKAYEVWFRDAWPHAALCSVHPLVYVPTRMPQYAL